MDTSWIDVPRGQPEYVVGCMQFIEFAKEGAVEGKILCPCKVCKVEKWFPVNEVESHILFKGFYTTYKNWIFHGNGDLLQREMGNDVGSTSEAPLGDERISIGRDDMGGLLGSTFRFDVPHSDLDLCDQSFDEADKYEDIDFEVDDSAQEDAVKYKKLLAACNEELYEGCNTFSKLSFILHLFHLKCMNHWSAESFNMLLTLILDAFPQVKEFPSSYYESKKMIKDLGLGYEKIDACPNNCILYRGEYSKKDKCHKCGASRWKTIKGKDVNSNNQDDTSFKKGQPAKVMRYFPLIPRLKRIYMSSKIAEDMRWHDMRWLDKERDKDDILRHPADALAWKDFDERYPDFSGDPRSVRLGLASDGFNPYRLMNTTHSTWPVVLIPYNLPPWLCVKSSTFLLSTIIPGKTGPGIDIDVYLQPLVHELKLLWNGVDAFDAYSGERFKLRASLLWTINDFPAYAMLSGLSTKGYKACPVCTNLTPSIKFAGKICYCCYRKWLPPNHPYRFQGEKFDGTVECGEAPKRPTGTEILRHQEKIHYVYGGRNKRNKRKKRGEDGEEDGNVDDDAVGTKKSIFFELEYWEHNLLRHNLDVMHIEKNVCDIILGTLLNMDNKNRDDMSSREAIKELGIKPHLWPKFNPNGEKYMPPASYTMSIEEKERFLKVLNKLRVPDGYGSNLSRCVNVKQRKLMNLKSHDNHVLMQDILPVALRASNATKVIDLLAKLSSFFKKLCSTTIDPKKLDLLQDEIIVTLCEMEMHFLPSFFTIMVHLVIHLVDEVKLGGPVQYRWMYPIERYLAHLKSHVTNKAQPEGSIAEGYLLEETIMFCSRFLVGVKTLFNRPKRIDDEVPDSSNYLFNCGGRVIGKEHNFKLDDKSLKQAHRYVLLHCDEMKELLDEFVHQKKQMTNVQNVATDVDESKWIIHEYGEWLQNQVDYIDESTRDGKLMKALAGGLNCYGKRMKGLMINGYKFQTTDRDCHLKTQNSGVMVEADGDAYYGRVKDIFELHYYGAFRVVLFCCEWVDIRRGVRAYQDGSVCVNFSKLMHTGRNLQDDPFVFSSQAKQVFFIEDEIRKGWFHVIKTKPRDLFDLGDALVGD